ncbi:MAG: hypothetical protein IPK59_23420 [Rhodospirillaceae bacterium]|nr:hypothetical protein [Rhodospirillaceae bacterium]
MKIDRDAFEEWMANPMTEAMMRACEVWEMEAKTLWVNASWGAGQTDAVVLARLRERARTLEQIRGVTAIKIEEALE